MSAYQRMTKLRQRELHENERPVAMVASILVNQQRDPKKGKPVDMSDFYLYQPLDDKNLPSGRYGAAALAMVKEGQYPSWALFCFKELSQSAYGEAPDLRAYIGSDCMLLAPVRAPGGYTGLFVGTESAGGQVREMKSPCGKTVTLKIPLVETKVVAEEDMYLQEI